MRKAEKGFTLVEVLLTVVILTIGLLAVHAGVSRCVEGIRYSEEKLFCSFLLEEKITNLLVGAPDPMSLSAGSWEGLKAQYKTTANQSTSSRNKTLYNSYELRVQGPIGSKMEALLMTPVPKKKI